MPNQPETFGQRLRRLRVAKNLSRERMAVSIGRSSSCLLWWERGGSSPTLEDLKHLSVALDIPIGELVEPATEQQA